MNDIFYAIDMGAPSAISSGFFCWKYNSRTQKLDSFQGVQGWYECIYSIVSDSSNAKIHLTIEAALWGMSNQNTKAWIRRFDFLEESGWSERPWYTGAGASTGLMAQEFLKQLIKENLLQTKNNNSKQLTKEKIILRESYISGLMKEGKRGSHKKPPSQLQIIGKSKHCLDAFEGLLLTLEKCDVLISDLEKALVKHQMKIDRWPKDKKTRIKIRESNTNFPLGLIESSDLFDFKNGEILFTKRDFNL